MPLTVFYPEIWNTYYLFLFLFNINDNCLLIIAFEIPEYYNKVSKDGFVSSHLLWILDRGAHYSISGTALLIAVLSDIGDLFTRIIGFVGSLRCFWIQHKFGHCSVHTNATVLLISLFGTLGMQIQSLALFFMMTF